MDNPIYNELCSGAKALLDSYFEDYQNKILVCIADKAIEENRKISEFTAKDIFEIHQLQNLRKDTRKQTDIKYKFMTIVAIIGLFYALTGAMLIYMKGGYGNNIYLFIIIVGCVTSLLGIFNSFLMDILKGRKTNKNWYNIDNDLLTEIKEIWETIQKITVVKNSNINGTNNSNIKAITWLMQADYLSQNDKIDLKEIINVRNMAVHEDYSNALSRKELKNIIYNGRNINKKLSDIQ